MCGIFRRELQHIGEKQSRRVRRQFTISLRLAIRLDGSGQDSLAKPVLIEKGVG
jgi:hypothetical protein